MIIKRHKNFVLWQKSIDLITKVHEITKILPKNEQYGLTAQMCRAALSVASKIGEGVAKQTRKDFIHNLSFAQGSLSELYTQLEVSQRLGFLNKTNTIEISELTEKIDSMITGLINTLEE